MQFTHNPSYVHTQHSYLPQFYKIEWNLSLQRFCKSFTEFSTRTITMYIDNLLRYLVQNRGEKYKDLCIAKDESIAVQGWDINAHTQIALN